MNLRTQQIPREEYYYPLSRTSAICPIPVLSLNHRTVTGDWTIDKHPVLDISLEETSRKENTNLRRGGDIDCLLLPPLLDHHLQTLVSAVESLKDPNNLIGREAEDRHLLLLHHQVIIRIILRMIKVDTKEVDRFRRL